MKRIIFVFALSLITVFGEEVRLLDLDPPDAQQAIESQDQSLHYAPKIESNVPAIRFLGNEPHHVQEDIYLARQYHGQDGLGGYLYGYNVPDIAKTEKKVAGGDLRGAYNYIAGDGQEIKVEYWDDGTGFHQIDNVPKILPTPIDDSPEVKAEKEKFLARWHEEAERNTHPVQSPYDSEGNYASGPLSPQAQLQQKQLLAQQQYQQPNQYGGQYQQPKQYQSSQYQSNAQYQQPNPYLQSSASSNQYQQSSTAQNQQPFGQNIGQYNSASPSSQSNSQYQQSSGQYQQPSGLNQKPNPYVQSSTPSNPYQQPSGASNQQGSGQYPIQPSTSSNQQSSGQYPVQSPVSAGQYQQSSTYSHQPASPYQSGAQNQVDYSGQYSENKNTYSQASPVALHQQSSGQHYQGQKPNQVDDDSGAYDGRYDEEEESTGPPKGFFYKFDYPVGIIVNKGAVAKREDIQGVYNENKEKFQAQLQAGHSDGGTQNGYLYVKN